VICEYSKYIRQKFTCGKKLADAGINEKCEILSFKKDKNGILTYIKYKQAGLEKEKKFTVEELKPVGESILDIWAREKPSVATFKNTRTGIYVRIYKNPIELVSKYRKCYGKFSQDSCSFPNESFEIYGYNKAEWRMIWYKQ
jgi:hypothetical protein